MQVGPSLHRSELNRRVFGIWSLRILAAHVRCTLSVPPASVHGERPVHEGIEALSSCRCSPVAIALTIGCEGDEAPAAWSSGAVVDTKNGMTLLEEVVPIADHQDQRGVA